MLVWVPSSLSLRSVVWQANPSHLPHPGVEGADVSSAKETSAAQIEYMVSKIALAALEDPKNTLGILKSMPVNTDCLFLREIYKCFDAVGNIARLCLL